MHDVGKIGISHAVLNRPDDLTPEELIYLRTHPELGEQIYKPLRSIHQLLPIIRQHGERYYSKGHPDGLAGNEICLGTRLVAIADVYDAMTSDRPYRKRMSSEQAIEILRDCADKQWDPELVELFVQMLEKEGFVDDTDSVLLSQCQ